MEIAEIGPPIEPPMPTLPGDMDRLTADAPAPAIGTAPGVLPPPGGEDVGMLMLLFCARPDEPVGLVPPMVLPMTKEPGGELLAKPPIDPGDMTPLGVPIPLPALLPTDPTSGEGDACGIASGVGISLPYSPFCFPAFDRAQSPESVGWYTKGERCNCQLHGSCRLTVNFAMYVA